MDDLNASRPHDEVPFIARRGVRVSQLQLVPCRVIGAPSELQAACRGKTSMNLGRATRHARVGSLKAVMGVGEVRCRSPNKLVINKTLFLLTWKGIWEEIAAAARMVEPAL